MKDWHMEYTDRLLVNERFLRVQREIREDEAERIYCRHEIEHGLDVCRIAWIMYLEDVISDNTVGKNTIRFSGGDSAKDRFYVTGLLHDVGRSLQYRTGEHHSTAGEKLAGQILKEIGYPEKWIRETVDFIRDHHGRQNVYTDKTAVGYYIERADQLSRNCFCCPAAATCKWKDEERNRTIRY